jgi:quercetin dioxygenase-like cupin family protein
MKGFVDNIENLTEDSGDFRRVLYMGKNLQLVLITIQPGEEIGEEVHEDRDQFFRFEVGEGEVWIDDVCNKVKADDLAHCYRPRRTGAAVVFYRSVSLNSMRLFRARLSSSSPSAIG